MKTAGVIISGCLGVVGALFIYVVMFEKGIPKEGRWFGLSLGIGCMGFATIIGLIVYVIDVLEEILNKDVKNETDI